MEPTLAGRCPGCGRPWVSAAAMRHPDAAPLHLEGRLPLALCWRCDRVAERVLWNSTARTVELATGERVR